jgi:hypothetical protein
MKTLLLIFLSLNLYANFHLAPSKFLTEDQKLAVFIDITKAEYQLIFDGKKGKIQVHSKIMFKTKDIGFPLFDLVPEIRSAKLNGKKVATRLQELKDKEASQPMILVLPEKPLESGSHTLEISHDLDTDDNVTKEKNGLSFLLKFCDGKGQRQLLERYLPANLQYDQYPATYFVDFKGLKDQIIIANGEVVSQRSPGKYQVHFPAYYNSAAPFFHTFPAGKHRIKKERRFGVDITVYTDKVNRLVKPARFLDTIENKLKDLDSLYGKWHYDFLIVFLGENFSGIEHVGATRTSRYSLDHEMFHMYYGRGAMPADGRSAWVDEGLARWRDGGSFMQIGRKKPYDQLEKLPKGFDGLGKQSPYMRTTFNYAHTRHEKYKYSWLNKIDKFINGKFKDDPYHDGAIFFAHMDYLMNGDLNNFLKVFNQQYKHQLYTQEMFFNELYAYLISSQQKQLKNKIQKLVQKYFN